MLAFNSSRITIIFHMSTPELDRQFYEILGSMELSADGIHDYEDVTVDVLQLQTDLLDHLAATGGFDPNNEAAAYDILKLLHEQLGKKLQRLERLQFGDHILASGDAIILTIDADGNQDIEILDNNVRLHGTVGQPFALEVPLMEDIFNDNEYLLPEDLALQLSAALEIGDAVIETVDHSTPEEALEPIRDNRRVFLPLIYPDLQIKRRIPKAI